MKQFIILTVLLLMTGCGAWERSYTKFTGKPTFKCVAGVSYLQSDSGITVQLDREGKPVACEEKL